MDGKRFRELGREYRYVGPAEIARLADVDIVRIELRTAQSVQEWIEATQCEAGPGGYCATYVVTTGGRLWLSDRHSEHVACARGKPVLAAGEITFSVDGSREVTEVTNQSTGYCPEPACWLHVESALADAVLEHPGGFTAVFDFRRCPDCRAINLLKDEVLECAVCGSDLPRSWNFG